MGRRTKGTLYKRGKNWYISYQIDGHRSKKALRDANGKPITSKAEAEKARAALMAPLALDDTKEALAVIAAKVQTAEQAAEAADSSRPRIPLALAWEKAPQHVTGGKTEGKLSASSVQNIENTVTRFVGFMMRRFPTVTYCDQVSTTHAKAFADDLKKTVAAASHNYYIGNLRRYWRFLELRDVWEPVRLMKGDEVAVKEPIPIDFIRECIERQLEGVHSNAAYECNVEKAAMLALGACTGMRMKDCALLQWKNVTPDLARLWRVTSKKKTTVHFPIHSMLREILAMLPRGDDEDYVLPTMAAVYERRSNNMSQMMGYALLNQYSFHSFRVTFATIMAQAGVPIYAVQEWLGHSCPEITRVYERHTIGRGSSLCMLALNAAFESVSAGDKRARLAEIVDTMPIELVDALLERIGDADALERFAAQADRQAIDTKNLLA